MAQQAVDDYLTQVSENTLLKEQDSVDIRGLRRELLENALRYYKRFRQRAEQRPILRRPVWRRPTIASDKSPAKSDRPRTRSPLIARP